MVVFMVLAFVDKCQNHEKWRPIWTILEKRDGQKYGLGLLCHLPSPGDPRSLSYFHMSAIDPAIDLHRQIWLRKCVVSVLLFPKLWNDPSRGGTMCSKMRKLLFQTSDFQRQLTEDFQPWLRIFNLDWKYTKTSENSKNWLTIMKIPGMGLKMCLNIIHSSSSVSFKILNPYHRKGKAKSQITVPPPRP